MERRRGKSERSEGGTGWEERRSQRRIRRRRRRRRGCAVGLLPSLEAEASRRGKRSVSKEGILSEKEMFNGGDVPLLLDPFLFLRRFLFGLS